MYCPICELKERRDPDIAVAKALKRRKMSVYVDKLRPCVQTKQWKYDRSCHLFADSIDELHKFAQSIGLPRLWFQYHIYIPHYDLTARRREQAVKHGAIEVDNRFMAMRIKEARLKEKE